jgi:hypothetical protein
LKTQLTTGIDPRVVHAEHCRCFPEQPGAEPSLYGLWQSNVNVLTTDELDACDQVTGNWPGRALLCRMSRVSLLDGKWRQSPVTPPFAGLANTHRQTPAVGR